jgi:transcriptional regulator with XRE-family HTH domain
MSELYVFIGERIRELRNLRVLNQEEFGKKIGVPTNTISRWESAIYKPSAEDLEKMGKKFDVPITYFFPETEQPNLRPSIQALMSATSDLTEQDLQEITEYAVFRKARAVMEAKKKPSKSR